MTLSVLGGVLLLCVMGGIIAVSAPDDTTDSADGAGSEPRPGGQEAAEGPSAAQPDDEEQPESLPSVGRDGQFEFSVVDVEAGVTEVNRMPGNEFWEGETAQGEYVLVTVEVENIGDSARTFSDFNQSAFDADDRRYEVDTQAGWEANGGTDVWLTDINPGNSVTGILVFDVPADTELMKLELHDSAFSGGVEVGLP